MPRSYYRCSICHSKVKFHLSLFSKGVLVLCLECKTFYSSKYKDSFYRCVHYSWYERLYLIIRDIIRRIKDDKRW